MTGYFFQGVKMFFWSKAFNGAGKITHNECITFSDWLILHGILQGISTQVILLTLNKAKWVKAS